MVGSCMSVLTLATVPLMRLTCTKKYIKPVAHVLKRVNRPRLSNNAHRFGTRCVALLNEFPTRHHLVLTGDFNTPAPLVRGLVGTKADMHRTPAVPDLRMLEALVTDFQLLHLNSWVRGAGPTFISPQSSSQIDHIFVRRTHPCLCTYVHVYGHGNECICTCTIPHQTHTHTNKPNGTQHVYVHMHLYSLYMYLYIYGVVRYAWYGMVWCGVVWYAVALGCKYCILLYV